MPRKKISDQRENARCLFTSPQVRERLELLSAIRDEVEKSLNTHFGGLFFDNLALCVVDTFFEIVHAADFYTGKKRIDFYETPASNMMQKQGLIDRLDFLQREPVNLIRGFRASGLDHNLLPIALGSLLTLLANLCAPRHEPAEGVNLTELEDFFYQFTELTEEELLSIESEPDYDDFKESLACISIELKNLQTILRLVEHEIYDAHPEWEVTWYESEDNPLDARQDRRNQSAALHDYYDKYGNPLSDFEANTNYLTRDYESAKTSLTAVASDYQSGLQRLLATPVCFQYESPVNDILSGGRDGIVRGSLNPWLKEAKERLVNALNEYVARLLKELPADGIERDLLKHTAISLHSARKDCMDENVQEKPKATPAKRHVGRPKSPDREDQLVKALDWLKCNPGKSARQAAEHVYDVSETFGKYPEGYKRPEPSKKRSDALVRDINRKRKNATKSKRTN